MRAAPPTVRGFTLAEILVSILIFSVVSLAMITILLTSTNVFRAGEHGRASTDEALTALGALDEDLKRLVPGADGGFFYAALYHYDVTAGTLPNNGNCAVAFTISAPQTVVSQSGQHSRLLVMYWVETLNLGKPDAEDVLYRATAPIAADLGRQKELDTVTEELVPTPAKPRPFEPTIVARRCLHFGTWISTELKPRSSPDDWTVDTAGAAIAPDINGADFCTELVAGQTPDPFPTAIRFTLTLSVGRYGPTGYVIEDNGTDRIRVSGLPAVPTVPGSVARIDDEWIRYTDYSGGALLVETARGGQRGARRTAVTQHVRPAKVLLGQTFSLARTFPH